MPGKLGCRGGGMWKYGEMVRERGGGRIGEGLGEWDRGREEGWLWEQEVYISTKGAILGYLRDLILEGFPGPRRGPQIVLWAAEERVPELALAHNHTDEYFAYHHRTFVWRWMEIETETHTGALD